MPAMPRRSDDRERLLAVAVRTLHLVAVVALGAALLGAPLPLGPAAAVTLASGAVLALMDLAAGRMRLGELAGAVVLLKLAVVAWIGFSAAGAAHALAAFWGLLVASSLSAHAPKALRHWRPARASKPGRPG